MIRVIIADDHRIFRQGLAGLLADDPDIELLGEAGNGVEALRLIRELRPDVAVLDVSMPRPDGIEIARQIIDEGYTTACLILTMHDDAVTMRRAMDAGAQGYLVKDGAFEELSVAVRHVSCGRAYFNAAMAQDSVSPTRTIVLTVREQEVLNLVAQGCSSKSIADQLGLSLRTVENHRQNIMKKLNIHSAPALAVYANNQRV